MKPLLICGARVIDPASDSDGVRDVYIENGRIAPVDTAPNGCERLDASGLTLAPGLVDMHVHLRDPGYLEKEDLESGCRAAAAGGFTAVACMPNTNPVCDNPQTVADIVSRSKGLAARVYPIASITKGLSGKTRTDFAALRRAGAVGVSDDGRPVSDSAVLLDALEQAMRDNILLTYHAETPEITGNGIMHLGLVSRRIQAQGVHRASEDCSTAQLIALSQATGAPAHVCHVSTAGSLALIRDAKRRGLKITCETAPHYFTLTHEMLLARDASFRMAPPLREESDRLAVLDAIADGTVDCIATDHAPHTQQDKADFEKAPNGVVGLETSLALCITRLVRPGVITLARLMRMMSFNPARLLGVPGGGLENGAEADIVLFDPNEKWTVDKNRFYSKGRNTPFDGMNVYGKVKLTFCGGLQTFPPLP